jgi:hypothetical protein
VLAYHACAWVLCRHGADTDVMNKLGRRPYDMIDKASPDTKDLEQMLEGVLQAIASILATSKQ